MRQEGPATTVGTTADVDGDEQTARWRDVVADPMNVLASAMRVSGSSLTKLVDRLSDLGYARRDASENDRRVVYVVLTPAGVEEAVRLRGRYVGVLRSRVLATVGGEAVGLAEVARRLASERPTREA